MTVKCENNFRTIFERRYTLCLRDDIEYCHKGKQRRSSL